MNSILRFYQSHLSRQIVTSGLGSIINFSILFFSASLFTSVVDASEFLALYSFSIILSAYFSYVLLFRNGQAEKLTIDLPFLLMILAMILAGSIYSPERWGLITTIVILMFLKDIYRFLGVKNSKNDKLLIKFCILIGTFIGLLILINYYFSIKFINSLALGIVFMLLLSPVFIFKLDKKTLLFSVKPRKMMNLFFNAAAEIMPILAGYFVNVYSIKLMMASEYVEYRQSFAVIGLSSLLGSISLLVFVSNKEAIIKHLRGLAALMLAALLAVLYFTDYLNIIIAATLLIFSISAVINSYNKINLSRAQYLCLTSIPAILIITYILNSSHLIPNQLLFVLSVIQIIYFGLSYFIIVNNKTNI